MQLGLELELSKQDVVSAVASPSVRWFGYAIDFGEGDALAVHGAAGPIPLPKKKFTEVLELLLTGDKLRGLPAGDVVCESATVGSCGVEPYVINSIVEQSTKALYVLSTRATKNYKKDNGLNWDKETKDDIATSHDGDAEIIHTVAVSQPERLKKWKLSENGFVRQHTSVRPHDKRGYQGEEPDRWMAYLPPFTSLPPHLQLFFSNGKKGKSRDYARARAMPFAMAFEEEGAHTRSGYERILGLYEHGFPSFYRRNIVSSMQREAKTAAGVRNMCDVPKEVRKQSLKTVRRNIRQFYHLSKNWQATHPQGTSHPVKGTADPVAGN